MSTVAFVRRVVWLVRDREVPFLAAAVAYYAFVSIPPLLIVTVSVATAVGGDRLATAVLDATGDALTPETQGIVRAALTPEAARGGATLVGLVALSWSGLRVFRGLDLAFSRLYGTADEETILDTVRDAGTVIGGIVLGVAVTATLLAVAARSTPLVRIVVGGLGLLVTLSVAFFPIYYVFPDASLRPREALPGATLAAAGWTGLSAVFGIYAERASFSAYGVLGGALLLVTWLYFAALVLLVAGAANAVLVDR